MSLFNLAVGSQVVGIGRASLVFDSEVVAIWSPNDEVREFVTSFERDFALRGSKVDDCWFFFSESEKDRVEFGVL